MTWNLKVVGCDVQLPSTPSTWKLSDPMASIIVWNSDDCFARER
jgi:hypothetical protein